MSEVDSSDDAKLRKRAAALKYSRSLKGLAARARFKAKVGAAYWADHHLLTKYGLTRDQWESLLEQQRGVCAICATEFTSIPCVDHDHETSAIRRLLCSGCNLILGLAGDDPEVLESAARYLRENRVALQPEVVRLVEHLEGLS